MKKMGSWDVHKVCFSYDFFVKKSQLSSVNSFSCKGIFTKYISLRNGIYTKYNATLRGHIGNAVAYSVHNVPGSHPTELTLDNFCVVDLITPANDAFGVMPCKGWG